MVGFNDDQYGVRAKIHFFLIQMADKECVLMKILRCVLIWFFKHQDVQSWLSLTSF